MPTKFPPKHLCKKDLGELTPLIFTQNIVMWGKWVLGYFNFSRKDRIGVLILVFLILFSFFLPRFFGSTTGRAIVPADTAWITKLRELEIKQEKVQKVRSREGFGGFRDADDESAYAWQYEKPRYSVTDRPYPYDSYPAHKPARFPDSNAPRYSRPFTKTSRYEIIDINTADTTAFIALPGIGSKLATRIINFREKLGGFYTIDQIAEVYGLQDSVFQKIKTWLQLNASSVKKININTASVDELKSHPYIRYNIANAIISYRNQHGPFGKVEDIKNIMIITEEQYPRIIQYLSLE